MDAKMQIRLPKELYEEFKNIAKDNAQVPSLLVRKWIESYIKDNKEELKMANFKHAGTWWTDKSIELVEIEGTVYALNGWNGEKYLNCWECIGEDNMEASKEEYVITPILKEIEEDEFEIVRYEIE